MSSSQGGRSSVPGDTENHSAGSKKEDPTSTRLRRAWRSFASSLVVAARAAEKSAKTASAKGSATEAEKKAVDDALVTMLRARSELRRVGSLVEARLRGNAKETEALELCLRSQPCIGRKRKRIPKADETAAS
mmetsp:Transcript_28242/g.83208  ORF Transcript_28242/g.83208 Transcript_28242/m.83208 type:complete len:133 (-) Transcript_28242:93-491(-)|eukprot:CAMPEP_0113527770 /NCGR_PEP_ID=MMETSP0015_2-20120614/1476_1 /TAXON_ID=2838 /ORGANISM="Odontella" /LENGTH=132 /DNA_ID=CAMNT_0000426233 /DNA_START=66 /DNA_END=464 /DNA_ORIENTATION=+ /assembly_acc=CAM_ASM_000160